MPIYDGDVDASEGLPPGALELRRRVEPRTRSSSPRPSTILDLPAPLKNAIDWVSRARPMPWRGKSVYLSSASPSPMGGIRGLWQTRIPLEGCGALVFPDMFALPHANEAFDEEGRLRDPGRTSGSGARWSGLRPLAEAVAPVCAARPRGPAAQQRRPQSWRRWRPRRSSSRRARLTCAGAGHSYNTKRGRAGRRMSGTVVVVSAETMGRGDDALGAKLLGNFLRNARGGRGPPGDGRLLQRGGEAPRVLVRRRSRPCSCSTTLGSSCSRASPASSTSGSPIRSRSGR